MNEPTNSVISSDAPVRVGVVGLGRSGYGIHLDAFKRRTDFVVGGVADPDAARATEVGSEFSCPVYADITQLLQDDSLDLIVVASPNRFHAPHAVLALQAGKNVVCEKPFGLTVSDVDAMVSARDAAAEKAGRPIILSPFQNRRFERLFQLVREIIKSGKLGQVTHIRMANHGFTRRWDWQTLRHTGGGQLNNNGPHAIDQALVFLSDLGVTDPNDIEVWGDLRNTLSSGDAEDHVRLTLRVPSRNDTPTIDIEFFATAAYGQDPLYVTGTKGGLKGNNKTITYKTVDWESMPPRPVTEVSTPDRSYNREDLEWHEETVSVSGEVGGGAGAAPSGGLSEQFYDALYATLRHNKPLVIAPEEVRSRIAVIEKARQSAGVPNPESAF